MSDKSTQAFVDATRNPYEAHQNAGMKYLHENNSGVEAVALTYKIYEQETGKSLVNTSNGVYETLNHLAHHRSDTPPQEPSTLANAKAAAQTLITDPKTSENQLEDILSGKVNARGDLVRSAGEMLNKDNPAADKMLDRLSEINPGLGDRMKHIRNIEDKTEQSAAFTGFIKEVMDGKHDYFQTSQAAYNFKQLADMKPSDPKFDEAFDKATNNYPALGNYLANYAIAAKSADATNSQLKETFAKQILQGQEVALSTPARNALDNMQQHQQVLELH